MLAFGGRNNTGGKVIGADWVHLGTHMHAFQQARLVNESWSPRSALPTGMAPDRGGVYPAELAGEMTAASGITTTATQSASILGTASLAGSSTTIATAIAHVTMKRMLAGSVTTTAILSCSMIGTARMTGSLNTGFQPSAEDIAQAVWGALVTITMEEGTMADRMQKLVTLGKFLALK